MPRVNGATTTNYAFKKLDDQDTLDYLTINELVDYIDSRINAVLGDAVITSDAPAENDILTFDGTDVVWAPPAP